VTTRHLVRREADARFTVSGGFGRWSVIDETGPAVHTGFGLCSLSPGSEVPAMVRSYEECFYVLAGPVVLETTEGARLLQAGDYGLVPVGLTRSWRNEGREVARWADMRAPQPRAQYHGDAFRVPNLSRLRARPIDVRDPRNRHFGHIEPEHMDADKQTQDMLDVSASMRTALGPGDVAFAGVGCLHSFRNVGGGMVRWLETQAPQPPRRHSYRFARDWDYLAGSGQEPS
jgi:mannose-6-phosphate isomerase-like protein (cupin superfamily)